MTMPKQFTFKVVGVSFVDTYPSNLDKLDEIAVRRYIGLDPGEIEPLPALFVRNPANEYDVNAIEVHIPALGDVAMIGHVPKAMAARWAPLLDAGEAWQGAVETVLIDPDYPDRPGISVRVQKANPA